MVRMSVLATCLKSIINAEKAGKRQVLPFYMSNPCLYRFFWDPSQRSWLSSLELCRNMVSPFAFQLVSNMFFCCVGYIGEFTIVDDKRAGKIVVELTGRLNKCGVISPRFDLKLTDFEKFIYNILPSRQFGYVILTTTYGIMDHEEAKRKHTGGKVLGYFFWGKQAGATWEIMRLFLAYDNYRLLLLSLIKLYIKYNASILKLFIYLSHNLLSINNII